MLHTKFRGNRLAGSGVEDFQRVCTICAYVGICGNGGHLVHVTSIMSSDFHFVLPESFHKKNWFRMAKYFLRKFGLNFCMYKTLGQGQEMTLTFNTQIHAYMQ